MEYNEDCNRVINDLINKSLQGKYVFRGYNTKNQIFPNLIRDNTNYNEKILIMKFMKYGSRFFKADSPIELLSTAQHYGLPTRLLDFTYNPLIALSFALYNEKDGNEENLDDRDYYYIRYANLDDNIYLSDLPDVIKFYVGGYNNENVGKKLLMKLESFERVFKGEISTDNELKDYIKGLEMCLLNEDNYDIIANKIKNNALVFIDPNLSNDRVVMQQGLFMMPHTIEKVTYESMIYKNTKEIRIHRNLRNNLIEILDKLGYNAFRLMPDLSSVCKEIVRNTI